MPATVEGIFRIVNRGSGPLKEIKRDATETQKATTSMGNAADEAGRKYERAMRTSSNATSSMSRNATRDIDKVILKLKEVEKTRATATIDVDIAKADAKIRLLRSEIRKLSTAEAQAELTGLGLIATDVASRIAGDGPTGAIQGGGGGGRRAGGLAAGFAAAGGRSLFMAAAFAAALPAVVALGGAVSALIGSLGAAALGAGALGTGVFGAAAVGVAGIAAAMVPAIKRIKESKKAQDDYNKAVEQYGDKSSQAIKAHKAMIAAFKEGPGTRQVLGNLNTLSNRWTNATRPGQTNAIGVINDTLETANRLLPTFATVSNSAMASARSAWRGFLAVFERREGRDFLRDMGAMFREDVGPFMRGLGNIATFFMRIARAARPEVKDMFRGFENMTAGWARNVGGASRTQGIVGRMVDQLKTWVDLFKAAGRLAVTFFGAGQRQGKSLVEDMTDQLNKWSGWLDRNPGKVQKFFDDSIESTKSLAGALGTIATTLFDISQILQPVLQGFGAFTGMLSPDVLGALGLLAGGRYVAGKFGRAGLLGRGAASAAGAGAAAAGGGGAAAAGGGLLAGITAKGALKGIGGAALRKAGPFAAAMFAYDFLSTGGSVGNRLGGATNSALLGLPNALGAGLGQAKPPVPGDRAASDWFGQGRSSDAIRSHIAMLGGRIPQVRGSVTTMDAQGFGARTERTYANAAQAQRAGATNIHAVLSDDSKRELQRQIDALKPVLRIQVAQQGIQQVNDLIDAFGIREQAKGTGAARKGLFGGLRRELATVGPDGKRALLHATADWTATLAQGDAHQKKTARQLREYIVEQYDKMGQHVSVVNGRILGGTQKEWAGISGAMKTEAERALQEVSKNFTAIQREAIGSLEAMGYSKGEARALVKGMESGGRAGRAASAAAETGVGTQSGTSVRGLVQGQRGHATERPKARGGRLGGVGLADYLSIGGGRAAPGELVVNQHSEARADRALGYPGALASLVSNETMPHSARTSRAFAFGGPTAGPGGATSGLHQGIAGAVDALLSQFPGLRVTSTTGGGHAKNSYHYRGMAADIGGAPALMNQAAGWIANTMGANLTEGIHNPNLSIKNGASVDPAFWGAKTWAEHIDHIHLAVAGALGALNGAGAAAPGGALAAAAPQLKKRKAGGAGVPNALAQAAIDAMTAGVQGNLNAAFGGAPGGGGGEFTGGGNLNSWLAQALRITGHYSKSNLAGLNRMAMGESGGNPNAIQKIQDINSKTGNLARGLLQVIPPTFARYHMPGYDNIMNPVDNAIASIQYQFARYGRIVGHPGYAMGGRLPFGGWMGDGGSFTASSPMMIGVGERGQRERVHVSRESAGGWSGGNGSISVNIGHIDYRAEGDLKKAIKKELDEVARELRFGPLGGEDELG